MFVIAHKLRGSCVNLPNQMPIDTRGYRAVTNHPTKKITPADAKRLSN